MERGNVRDQRQEVGLPFVFFSLRFIYLWLCLVFGEGNGNPLQCSCLENPRDGGAWWAAVYGVAQSRTQLKRLSSSSSSMVLRKTLENPLDSKEIKPVNPKENQP